jgi:hypothetical protein
LFPPVAPTEERTLARRDAAYWFALSIAALGVAAVFSLVLVVGRTPFFLTLVSGDTEFARRSLVVHVNLSLGVWFFCNLAGLFCLMPGARKFRTAPVAVFLATIGIIAFSIPMFFRRATPILSDYVPVLNHPLFYIGLIIFAVGIALNFADARLWPAAPTHSDIPVEAQHGVRIAAFTFFVALLTMAGAYSTRQSGADVATYFQHLFWGSGHVFQAVNTLGMLVAWLILLRHLTGKTGVSTTVAGTFFLLILLCHVGAPWVAFNNLSPRWFTHMMEFGLFPAVLAFLGFGLITLWRHRKTLNTRTPAFVGFTSSALMALIGFGLGGMITVSNTLIPAHYHANIGAVTVAYMAMMLALLSETGHTISWPRLAAWQPSIYAVGQMAFVLGYAIAGTFGDAARKTYGQAPSHQPAWLGMAIAGAGGAVALIGGVIFVLIVIKTVLAARRDEEPPHEYRQDEVNESTPAMNVPR